MYFQGSCIYKGIKSRYYRNRVHSNCLFPTLKRFNKVYVYNTFLINDDKILSLLLNL